MLETLLSDTSNSAPIKIAALQNRTRIAFTENSDQKNWAAQYKEALNASGQNTTLNRARLLRFEAALDLYRNAVHSPGIVAILTEWAIIEAN